jgi:hypothetical protein
MKLTTITIPAVEMTRAEWGKLWEAYNGLGAEVDGKQVVDWDHDDGHNSIFLKGEDRYRAVVVTDWHNKTHE